MTVDGFSNDKVHLTAEQVVSVYCRASEILHSIDQVWMMNKKKKPTSLEGLDYKDTDLTMFTIKNLTLDNEKNSNMVVMTLKLKRKVVTELLTTYLPTILLLLITFVTIFFDKDLFSDVDICLLYFPKGVFSPISDKLTFRKSES